MKNARTASGMTQAQVAEKLGVTFQAISNYERGINSIESDVLVRLCEIYDVNPILILSDLYTCPVCGFSYDSGLPRDVLEHDLHHARFDSAAKKYGFCYALNELNKIKREAYGALDSNGSLLEKRSAAISLMKAYFSSSLSANAFSLTHPNFNEYVAMLLNQAHFRSRFGKDVYSSLVDEYGAKPGIPEGKTTYERHDIVDLPTEKSDKGAETAPSDLTGGAIKLAKDYDTLDPFGKKQVRDVADNELARCEDETRFLAETAEPEEPRIIPLFLSPAAAGYASPVLGEDYDDYALKPEDPQGAMFAVKVQGDSMEPHFPDGSIVFCNKDPLRDGDIGVFAVDESTVVKQYHKQGGVVYLFSLNRKRADADVVLPSTSGRGFGCQGRVITRRRYPVPGR